jgi:nucleoside-diphosphate-sugar epimerase
MRSLSRIAEGILVTGSSGFVGTHFCREMARRDGLRPETREATVVHLAGYGLSVAPVSFAPGMYATAIEGTLNVLRSFRPTTLLMASTSAVYGETGGRGAVAAETPSRPLGLYGLSRAASEAVANAWASETGNSAIVFRLGNVIGADCRGMIPYLVEHALRYPEASVPARMRGGGQIIRDYVPISHVVRVLANAALHAPKTLQSCFNVGTGRGTANGEIAEIVTAILAEQGYRLRIEYADEPAPEEARRVLLDVASTTAAFDVAPPSRDAVVEAIADSVFSRLGRLTSRNSASRFPPGTVNQAPPLDRDPERY